MRTDATAPIKVLYIAGVGRSGSTLLDRLLNEVEGYCALGEMTRFVWQRGLHENRLCGSGEPFRHSSFWQQVFLHAYGGMKELNAKEMIQMQRAVSRRRHLPQYMSGTLSPSLKKALSCYLHKMSKLMHAIYDTSGATVLGDTSKRPLEACILNSIPSVSVYLLHLVRDPRAVSYSWQRKKKKREITGETVYMPQLKPRETSFWWLQENLKIQLLQIMGFPYMRVYYERLVQNPKSVINDILEFINIQAEAPYISSDNVVRLGSDNSVSGNPMRFKSGKIEIRSDNDWVDRMSYKDKLYISFITMPLMVYYGYRIIK